MPAVALQHLANVAAYDRGFCSALVSVFFFLFLGEIFEGSDCEVRTATYERSIHKED